MEHGVRVLAWQQTVDAENGNNWPQPIGLRGDAEVGGVKRDSLQLDALLAERRARRQAELQAMKEGSPA